MITQTFRSFPYKNRLMTVGTVYRFTILDALYVGRDSGVNFAFFWLTHAFLVSKAHIERLSILYYSVTVTKPLIT
jgi:hypothetical protein